MPEASKDSWVAQMKAKHHAGLEPAEAVERSLKATLNKLTPEKFDTLILQIIDILAKNPRPEHVRQLVKLLFEKSTTQHVFLKVYVDTCERLLEWFQSVDEATGLDRIHEDLESDQTFADTLAKLTAAKTPGAQIPPTL